MTFGSVLEVVDFGTTILVVTMMKPHFKIVQTYHVLYTLVTGLLRCMKIATSQLYYGFLRCGIMAFRGRSPRNYNTIPNTHTP